MLNLNKTSTLLIFTTLLTVLTGHLFAGNNEDFGLIGGVTEWYFTHAGYSDSFWWGNNQARHPYGRHEMLSGEWAAALWWSGCGSNDAIWLTDEFEVPSFPTGTIFESVSLNGNPPYDTWDDPNNPIPGEDTGYATIQDTQDKIQIRMDFELVDLGEQDANGSGGSPITFKEANSVEHFVYSERYILL